uniref:Nramp family divalent metal transporter n=1 Tax=Roseihalotalea indica TaxID=2867963 RepID=A0AA49GLI4_9BACT|nr:Nramp family divalent metal transporter [Tunicatimonas sp. TK19036]
MHDPSSPRATSLIARIRQLISAYGPAIFVIGAIIGTGSVSSLVWSGAEYGMDLLWALLLSCFFFWVLISSISRLTFASGQTFVGLAKTHFGKVGSFYIVFAIVVTQFTSNVGVLGIVTESFAAWLNLNPLMVSIGWSGLIYFLIAFGKYATFERVLIFFVTILGLSFIVNMFLAPPSLASVGSGLLPGIPEGGGVIAAAMVGTTLAGSVIVMRSYIVYDKGWTLNDLNHANRDAKLSGLMIFIVSAVIMACASATLHVRGMHIENALDMAYTLVPLMGKFAATLFVVGIVSAGVSSAFTNALVSTWSIADFAGWSRDARTIRFRLLAIPFCAAGIIAPLFGGKPVLLQIMSLALQAIFLPLLVLFLLILTNKESVIGKHKSSTFINVLTVVTLLFSLFMAYQAFVGLGGLLQKV